MVRIESASRLASFKLRKCLIAIARRLDVILSRPAYEYLARFPLLTAGLEDRHQFALRVKGEDGGVVNLRLPADEAAMTNAINIVRAEGHAAVLRQRVIRRDDVPKPCIAAADHGTKR